MSLSEIRNVVLLFSNPLFSGENSLPTTVIRNITAVASQLAFESQISTNLTTLTTTNAETLNGAIQGLLYVPTIDSSDPCSEDQFDPSIGLPRNVTQRSNLPPTNYKLIALAPWFSKECTQAYLQAARYDPVKGFIFYKPNNSTHKPQDVDEPIWDLDDGGAWIKQNKFPIFAIPGREGKRLVRKLAQYSGSIEQVPFGEEILDAFGPNPRDYVRIWTELTMHDTKSMPALWTFFVIVIGALLFIIFCVSVFMHLLQRQRRKTLATRVKQGEVDLEAMGIARVMVPEEHVKSFPLYTYQSESERMSGPSTPGSIRSSRRAERVASSVISISGRSSRSSLAGSECSTIATNYQPQCQICLESFKNRVSVIRQLPCYHIFHPECIDEFLTGNSSLCPVCQQCMLPRGYCPKITNAMVRRERAMRRLRGTVDVEIDSADDKGKGKLFSKHLFSDLITPSNTSSAIPLSPVKSPEPTKQNVVESPDSAPVPGDNGDAQTAEPRTTEPDSPRDPDAISQPSQTPPMAVTESEDTVSALPPIAHNKKSRRKKPRKLKLGPMEGTPLSDHQPDGRKSPSDLARARMKHLARPLDDEQDRPMCKWQQMSSTPFRYLKVN
ncbi:hypothetical protein jhhlp_001037 [Lomentospora prolificans]|uniref:RING-type domain-containing protein n=1 Tax=Lomentospora prolificans TaxID=41688 RepID=A0A2N3NK50_9PEZI|nr:hypothetical protein jhhlp_001037 [Lomentospora prolificans]